MQRALPPARAGYASLAGRFGWAMFDWANQPYFTLVTTFIFAPYLATVVIGDAVAGQAAWGYVQAAAGIAIAILSPLLGAIADAHGPKKPWTLAFQALGIAACAALWIAVPGAPGALWPTFLALALASIAAEFSIVFNNAMLPHLVPPSHLGRLSGRAWATGYAGGLLSLFLVLFAFHLPAEPLFGLDKAAFEHVRIVGPLSALWMALFIVPLFLFTPDTGRLGPSLGQAVGRGLASLVETARQARRYRNIVRFLLARMLYYDGLTAVFAFGGVYAAGSFGWSSETLGIFGIVITLFAAVGAYVGGWLDDRFGSKRTIVVALAGVTAATLGVVSIGVEPWAAGAARHSVFFIYDYDWRPPAGAGLFESPAERVFLALAVAIGIFGGPLQAASRTMLARLAPAGMTAQLYGLFALSGKATAFLAPLAVAVVTESLASQRLGLAVILAFFVAGWALLQRVSERRAEA
jgi:UMF1 family MFS transporter